MITALVAARRAEGVTQAELAKRLGKSQGFISEIETRERRLDVLEFYAVAQALGRDPVDVFRSISQQLPKLVRI